MKGYQGLLGRPEREDPKEIPAMLDRSVYRGLLALLGGPGPREVAARLVETARPEQLAPLGRLAQAVHQEIQDRLAQRARAGMPGPPGLPDPLAQRAHPVRPARTGTR